jgi:hypothetical protein
MSIFLVLLLYKKELAVAIQDDSRQVDEALSLKTWSKVNGGKRKGRFYGAGNLAANYRKGARTLHMKIADGEGTSQPPTLTPDMQEMIRKLAHDEALALVKQMLSKQQSFDEQLQQEQARSQKLQQELSQLKSNIRQTPGVEDHEDDSPYPIYGEEEEEDEEEEEEEDEDVEA